MNYYDAVLLLVPLSFLSLSGTAFIVGLSLEVAVMVGGVSSVAIVGHAMFANPPVDVFKPDNSQMDSNSTTLNNDVISDD